MTIWTAKTCAYVLVFALILQLCAPPARAYAVLSHEAIIDAAWEQNIKPILRKRFPNATADELRQAHAFAYGGSIIQDMGYYPHGSHLFSDLTHYVRSGDFVMALLNDAQDLNGLAFALGAMAHYAADNEGHRLGTNLAVPVLYPRLRKKYGDVVNYEEDPLAHVKTEFGFDVLEVAQHRYAPDAYHDFIGFDVDQRLLEQAFCETYSLELTDVLEDEDKVLNSYRRDVSQLLPRATRVAWSLKKKEIRHDAPGTTRKKFLYNMSRASYRKQWGKDYKGPGAWDDFLAFLYKLLPKFGPLRVLQLRTPTPQTEKMFESSFNAAMDHYRRLLKQVQQGEQPDLPNYNFDIGKPTPPGQYWLTDDTYAKLLDGLAKRDFAGLSPALRSEILNFYSEPDGAYTTKRHRKLWAKVQEDLQQLKTATPGSVAAKAESQPQL